MKKHHPINVSPYATNVLDLCGRTLHTPDGRKVEILRGMCDFVIKVGGQKPFTHGDNLTVSRYLNSFEVGILEN